MSNPLSASFDRVLIAIDGSRSSQWALFVGEQMAKQLCACVMLVYVVPPELLVTDAFELAERAQAVRKGAGLELLERCRLMLSPKLRVKTRLRLGLPADQIAAAARDWKADLIVMGTRGHSPLAQIALGSTARAVMSQAPCPVITVAHEPDSAQAEKEEWVGVGADCMDPISAHAEPARD